jgi:hypothetical protein
MVLEREATVESDFEVTIVFNGNLDGIHQVGAFVFGLYGFGGNSAVVAIQLMVPW